MSGCLSIWKSKNIFNNSNRITPSFFVDLYFHQSRTTIHIVLLKKGSICCQSFISFIRIDLTFLLIFGFVLASARLMSSTFHRFFGVKLPWYCLLKKQSLSVSIWYKYNRKEYPRWMTNEEKWEHFKVNTVLYFMWKSYHSLLHKYFICIRIGF